MHQPATPQPPTAPPLCRSVLDNGTRCQAPARRGRLFCRHHDPASLAPPPPPQPKRAPARFTDPWRSLHDCIAVALDDNELHGYLDAVMPAVAGGRISHRRAGALLAAIQNRRFQLQQARFLALADYYSRLGFRPDPPDPSGEIEPLLSQLLADDRQDLKQAICLKTK